MTLFQKIIASIFLLGSSALWAAGAMEREQIQLLPVGKEEYPIQNNTASLLMYDLDYDANKFYTKNVQITGTQLFIERSVEQISPHQQKIEYNLYDKSLAGRSYELGKPGYGWYSCHIWPHGSHISSSHREAVAKGSDYSDEGTRQICNQYEELFLTSKRNFEALSPSERQRALLPVPEHKETYPIEEEDLVEYFSYPFALMGSLMIERSVQSITSDKQKMSYRIYDATLPLNDRRQPHLRCEYPHGTCLPDGKHEQFMQLFEFAKQRYARMTGRA